jgi:hypothetical protein
MLFVLAISGFAFAMFFGIAIGITCWDQLDVLPIHMAAAELFSVRSLKLLLQHMHLLLQIQILLLYSQT